MPPSYESFCGADLSRLCVDDRLVMQLELIVLNGAPKLFLELVAFRDRLAQRRVENVIAVPPGRFCPVQSHISHFQKAFRICPMLSRQGDANASSNNNFMAFDSVGL